MKTRTASILAFSVFALGMLPLLLFISTIRCRN